MSRKVVVAWYVVLLLGPHLAVALAEPTFAATSPWTQTDWSGGSGQTSWSDATKYDSASSVTTTTAGQATLTNTERFSNTGLETDLTGWTSNSESSGGTFSDSTFAADSGAVAAWPLDDTTSTQSYARVVNPAVSTGRNVVIDSGFDDASKWTTGAGWSVTGSKAVGTTVTAGVAISQTTTPLVSGKTYSVTFDLVATSGSVRVELGSTGGTTRSSSGTFTETIIANGTNLRFNSQSTFTGTIDNVSVQQLSIPAYNSASATQLLPDGDMESAGVSSWSALNSTLTKETSGQHSGSQYLRVQRNNAANPTARRDGVLTIGSIYRLTGYLRSDGFTTPRITDGTTVLFTGTTSTVWQPVDMVFRASDTKIDLGSTTNTGTQYAEFDDITLTTDTYIRPAELFEDGTMEASGTNYWIGLSNNPTLTKQAASPHGGSQVLRMARSSGSVSIVNQIGRNFVAGRTYRFTGWVRSDGNATPRISNSGGTLYYSGSTSTSWTFFDTTFVYPSTGVTGLTIVASVDGQYVEWDDISATEVNPLVGIPINGVTVGASSNGHLTNAYTFDGVNDQVNIYSSDLNSAFNPSEGSISLWAKVSSSGVWSDTLTRYIMFMQADGSNRLFLYKNSTNNLLSVNYTAGGTLLVNHFDTGGPTGWFNLVLTWSKSNDQVKMYVNGVQRGSTLTGMGTWVGNLASANTWFGLGWSGQMNDVRLYSRALSASEIATMYSANATTRDTGTFRTGTASMKVVTDASNKANVIQSVNVGNTNSYNLMAYARTDGSAVTSADAELYYNGATVSTTYTSVGSGWYRLSGTVTGANAARNYGVQIKVGKTVYLDDFSLNSYATSGTLTSSIFDTGQGSNWGALTYTVTTPTSTTVTVKARSSNSSTMSGATAFSSCAAITSGSDISTNNCMIDAQRYVQYQFTLTNSDTTVTPTFQDLSLTFAISDATPPAITLNALSPDPNTNTTPTLTGTATDDLYLVSNVEFQVDSASGSWTTCTAEDGAFDEASENFNCTTGELSDGSHTIYVRATDSYGNITSSNFATDTFVIDQTASSAIELQSPDNESYTSNERPAFRWKASSDATAGINKYVLEIDNPSLGNTQPSGDFTINDIPQSRTTDLETNKYSIHYENFADNDDTNNYISVVTKSSKEWSSDSQSGENDGNLREGVVRWKVTAVDGAGNRTASSRTVFVDRTNPNVELTQLNDVPLTTPSFATTDTTPTIFGKVIDPLAGGDLSQTQTESGPRVASGPKQLELKLERQTGLTYQLVGTTIINMDQPWYTCSQQPISNNTQQKCDKYLPFEYSFKEKLSSGSYRISATAKDKVENTSSTSTFTLQILQLAEYATPAELEVIETKIKDLPPAEQETIKENLELTKPITEKSPSIVTVKTEQVAAVQQSIFNRIGSAFAKSMAALTQGVRVAITAVGDGLAFLGNTLARGTNAVANWTGGTLKVALQNLSRGIETASLALKNGIRHTTDRATLAMIDFLYQFVSEPTQIYDVKVAILSPTEAKISWQTNIPANGKVNYGLDESYSMDVQTDKRTTNHEFTLTNLQPDTEYHFEVMSHGKTYVYDANRRFRTPAE